MPGREIEEQVLHDHIVKVLHLEYYHYPSKRHPHLMTYVNHPSKSKAVRGPDGRDCFPDIIVLRAGSDKLELVAEVETESTIDSEEAKEWESFRSLGCRFHLYFPRDAGIRVAALCPPDERVELVRYWKEGSRYVLEQFAGGEARPMGAAAPVDMRTALKNTGGVTIPRKERV